MSKVNTLLLCICFITVLFPQPGYIHPDEFFQSSEIVAGDILDVVHYRAWEFNSTFPLRSVVFPYVLNAPPLLFLKWMNSSYFSGFKLTAVKVVMATRLPIAFLSVFGYLATKKLAHHFTADKTLSATLWCSSYVFWSYYTRSFSNSIESFLFALLLMLTIGSSSTSPTMHDKSKKEDTKVHGRSKIETGGNDTISESKDKLSSSKSKHSRSKVAIESVRQPDLSNIKLISFLIGLLVTVGFFNRPTFLLFAAVPVLYWFVSLIKKSPSKASNFSLFITVKLFGGLGAATAFITFVFIDTAYYNADFHSNLFTIVGVLSENPFLFSSFRTCFQILQSSVVVTPWNFLIYNVDSSNLAQHGIHPKYTHFLVNIPLLIGPLCIPFLTVCLSSVYMSIRRSNNESSSSASSKQNRDQNHTSLLWLVAMALLPLLGLSVFPHQEPRFLIPLLPVFIVVGARLIPAMSSGKKVFIIMWAVFNIVLHLVYGYFHQAAMIPVLSVYQQRLSASVSNPTKQSSNLEHMIFYKTYPPPRHLLLLRNPGSQVEIHDLAGSEFRVLMKLVRGLGREMRKPKAKLRAYVFLPSTASHRFLDHVNDSNDLSATTNSICPHLSVESLPRFRDFFKKRISFDNFMMDFCLNVIQVSAKLKN